jgi:hypothetical protein
MSLADLSEQLKKANEDRTELYVDVYDYIKAVVHDTPTLKEYRLELMDTAQKIKAVTPEPGDLAEEKSDKKNFDKRMLDTLVEIAANTKGGNKGDGSKKQGVFSHALAGGLGFMAKGMGAGVALASLGAGLGALFAGLALADAAGNYLKINGQALKTQIVTLSQAFSEAPKDGLMILGGILAGTGAFGAIFGGKASRRAGGGMAALGLGIGGFFAGLAVGDKAMAWMNVDGSKLKSMMINLAEGLSAFSGGQLAGLSALLAVGGIFGALPKGMGLKILGKAALGMTAIGAGIGGFFAGLALGDKAMSWMNVDGSNLRDMMINLGKGLTGLTSPDYTKLLGFPAIAATTAAGIAALTFASSVDGIGKIFEGVTRFVTGDTSSVYERITEGLKSLETVDLSKLEKFDPASNAVLKMTSALSELSNTDFNFRNTKKEISELGELIALTLPMYEAMYEGGKSKTPKGQELEFKPGLKNIPNETFSKIDSILSINDASRQASPTSSSNMSSLIKENDETKNAPQIVAIDNSTSNVSSGGGGGGTSIVTGNLTSTDPQDPYVGTRR